MKPKLVFWFILSFLIVLRIYFLDADLPAWKIANTSTKDEGYYSIEGLINYHSDKNEDYEPMVEDPQKYSTSYQKIQNTFTYYSLKIFGNNYFGLRLPSVIFYLLTSILLYYLVNIILKDESSFYEKKKEFFEFFFYSIILINFFIFTMGMTTEPMIWRMLFISLNILIFYYFFKQKIITKFISLFILGFLSTFSVIFVYPFNAFIIPSIYLAILIICTEKKLTKYLSITTFFAIGIVACLLVFNFSIMIFENNNIISFFQKLLSTGSNMGVLNPGTNKPAAKIFYHLFNIYSVFSTNIFRYNIAFLFLTLLSIPVIYYRIFKMKKQFDILLITSVFFFIVQTFFVNNSSYRKGIIIFPIVLLMILLSAFSLKDFLKYLKDNIKLNSIFIIYFIITGIFSFIVIYLEFFFKWPANIQETKLNNDFIITIQIISLLVLFVALIFYFLKYKINKQQHQNYLKYVILILIMIPHLYLFGEYISNISYSSKEIRQDMGRRIGSGHVIGGWNYGYWVYTDFKPYLSFYKYFNSKRMDEYYKILKSICNTKENVFVIIDDIGTSDEMKDILFNQKLYNFKIDTFYLEPDYKNPNPKYKIMLYKKDIKSHNQDKVINQ